MVLGGWGGGLGGCSGIQGLGVWGIWGLGILDLGGRVWGYATHQIGRGAQLFDAFLVCMVSSGSKVAGRMGGLA